MLRILSWLLLQLFFIRAVAQQHIVTGKILAHESGLPLQSATIKIKGTIYIAQSNAEGFYSIPIPNDKSVLIFSYLGYQPYETIVGKNTIINVSLTLERNQLNEVMVVAYGTTERKNFTGSASVINSSNFENRSITSFEKALQGAATGVQVTSVSGQPGSTSTVRIRGVGSLDGSSSPLYVLDGIVITSGNMSYMGQNLDVTNTADVLSLLNPNDIESVTVLKDASAAAIYGSRAANGVILINTKKGTAGNTKFSATISSGFSHQAVKKHQVLSGDEYYKLFWDANYNQKISEGLASNAAVNSANETTNTMLFSSKTKNNYNTPSPYINQGVLAPNAALLYNTDWRDEVLDNGVTKNVNVSATGGNEKLKFFVSGAYFNQDGIVVGSDFKRYSGRFNFSNTVNANFSFGINNSISYADQNTPPGAGGAANPVRFSDLISNIYPLYILDNLGNPVTDASGKKLYNYTNPIALDYNPIGLAELDEYNTRTGRVITSPYAELKFLKHFNARSILGIDYITNRERQFYNSLHGNAVGTGRGYRYSREDITLTFLNTIGYINTFGRHSINVLAGQEAFRSKLDNNYSQATNFAIPGLEELISASTPSIARSFYTEKRFQSYFTRANYNLDNKYYFSGSFRRDGSSVFGINKQFGNFYSVGGAWRISQEKFIKKISFIDDIKIKASYGVSGNDKLSTDNNRSLDGRYLWQGLYSLGRNYEGQSGIVYTQLENPELMWEKNTSANLSIEFAVLKNRLYGEFSYYKRGSDGLLYNKPLSKLTGFEAINTNLAAMDNYGIEMLVNAKPLTGKKFDWSISFNFSKNTNKIRKLSQEFLFDDGFKRWEEGTNRYQWFIREYAGVDPQNGRPLWYMDERNANGELTGNRLTTSIWSQATQYNHFGSSLPKYTGGFNNTLQYLQFDFSLYSYFSVGNKIYDNLYAAIMHNGSLKGQQLSKDVLHAWQEPGENNSIPRFSVKDNDLGNSTSSRFLVNGSYMRVKNITLGYTLQKSILQQLKLSSARFYIMAENPITFAKHKGMDPEVEISGIANNDVPNIKTLSVGINIGL